MIGCGFLIFAHVLILDSSFSSPCALPKHLCSRFHYFESSLLAELIFEAAAFKQALPDSIMAVFYLEDDCGDAYSGPKCQDYGKAAHRAIAQHFGLAPERLPLLKLNLWLWDAPFEEMPTS